MIAALFVQTDGIYFGLPDVDPWDELRDARMYNGPYPVVAHPPCQRWGRYWFGGPSCRVRKQLGDDDGCFASALRSVRLYGGVIEHPEGSHAWRAFKINCPPKSGGWIIADEFGGYTCCVEQGHYGHRARKATWLYVYGLRERDLPILVWGASNGIRFDAGYHTAAERAASKASGIHVPVEWLTKHERAATPALFRDMLLSIARKVI